uniref:Major facilitator superfamily (MFS) profile domain-containing protein n=1 Tax=Daphnia galeata TaxID=27404 RepID=A0A8J2RTE4_9CRUS|nr:unnamed protein product [Daphnia galeata]
MAKNKSAVELKEMKNGEIVEEDSDDGPVHVVPPDGGWGWVVMMASFCCNIIVDGIIFSFGLVVTNLAESFEVPVSTVSWVASLLAGFYLLAGPFVSSLATRFGFRTVACAGSVVAGLSFAVASLAMSVEFLYVFIGVLGGIGMGLVYVPAVVAVGFYFEKRRALATGIAVCGSGIGTFVLAPFTTWLLGYYGWRGTLLIHAGLVLNCAIFGAMFRPLEPTKKKKITRRQLANEEEVSAGTPLMVRIKRERDEKLRDDDQQEAMNQQQQTDHFHSSTNSLNNTVKLVGIKAKRSSTLTDSASSLGKKEKETPLLAAAGANIPEVVEETDGKKKSNGCMRAVSSLIQFSLFKSPTFNLLCFASFITFLGFFVPFMFLAARAEQLGADKESASFLLSIIGITNTLGRVACGALSDHPKVNVLMVNNAALTLGGVVTIATPFFPAYEMLIVYACLFGLSIACFASLRSILMVELLGLENLTNAFGLCLMFTGVSATVGGPLASMFYDATNDYDASF